MYANGYVGTAQDSQRIRKQEKQREEQRKKFEEAQKQKREQAAGLRQFGSSKAEAYEAAFKNETVGLVTREEFIQKRTTIQERLEEEELKERLEAEAAAKAEKDKRKREKSKKKPKLSFLADEEEDEEATAAGKADEPGASKPAAGAASTAAAAAVADGDGPSTSGREERPVAESETAAAAGAAEPAAKRPKLGFGKLGKDPTVKTDFLPDKDREMLEEELRQQLRKQWLAEQERKKNEPLEITYSYWDGSGHRRKITVRQGDSIGSFLKQVREQLAPQFRELRAVSVDNLMYIKEDLILPHHHTFYELIINKARGKSGPLFDFGVFEDVRIVNDATVEKQDAHAGKVVERHWYERNKHIFPASRWEIYDPEKTYDKYTIKG